MMTGYILAGGQSVRMGRDKAFLPVGSQTLIEIVIRRLRPCVDRLIVLGHARNASRLRALPVDDVLTDVAPGCGPLMGIYTGLMHTNTPLNVFVSCDMPWLEPRVIDRLVDGWRERIDSVAGVHALEGIQPFPLVCHTNVCRRVGVLLDRGERSLKSLLSHPCARLIAIEEPELRRSFTNINTVADYAKLQEDFSPLPQKMCDSKFSHP